MSENKHEKLAKLMAQMVKNIDEHFEKVANKVDFLQFYFYEKCFIKGMSPTSEKTLGEMAKTHHKGLQMLSSSFQERASASGIATISKRPILFKSTILDRQTQGIFIPWGCKIVYSEDNDKNIRESSQKAFLYCPDPSELFAYTDWFESEDASDSLTNIMASIGADYAAKELIKVNLIKDPLSIYRESVDDWRDSVDNNYDHLLKDPMDLERVGFAPKRGQSLALAYEAVLESISLKKHRHLQHLRKIYKKKLEVAIFENVGWRECEQIAFLNDWKSRFFKKTTTLKGKSDGRWDQSQIIDRYTAADFIKYFVKKFIENPKDKKMGEIACILWTMVWWSYEDDFEKPTLTSIVNLSSSQISGDDLEITIGENKTEVSIGLFNLLRCLRGEGTGQRSHRLFKNVNIKGLERACIEASVKMFGKDALPVLPSAFLASPHLYRGVRMSRDQRMAMKRARPVVSVTPTRKEVLKSLKKAFQRKLLA